MTKDEQGRQWLVREIAQDLRLRPEVVDLVLKRFQDIAVESMVNDDKFVLDGLFTVNANDHESRIGPDGKKLPPQRRLSVKLSTNIRKLYRLQHDKFSDKPGIINRDTWRDALRWQRTTGSSPDSKKKKVVRTVVPIPRGLPTPPSV